MFLPLYKLKKMKSFGLTIIDSCDDCYTSAERGCAMVGCTHHKTQESPVQRIQLRKAWAQQIVDSVFRNGGDS